MRSDFQVRQIEPHELDTWDAFVHASPQGTLFHTTDWKRIIDSSYSPASLEFFGCFDSRGLVAGCALMDRTRLGHRTAVTPLLTPYTGFLLREVTGGSISDHVSEQGHALTALAQYLTHKYEYQHLILPPGLDDVRPLQHAGYTVTPRYTYLLNLKLPAEELWQRFDGSVRRQIKKAEKCDFSVTGMLQPNRGFEIFRATFERRGQKCPVDSRLFGQIVTSENLRDSREIFCATSGDAIAGFIVTLRQGRTLYYALAATDEAFLQTGVSSFLIWQVLKAHACQELETLDFVGANVPSIARFKEGFSPKLVTHYDAESFGSQYMKFGKQLVHFLRNR